MRTQTLSSENLKKVLIPKSQRTLENVSKQTFLSNKRVSIFLDADITKLFGRKTLGRVVFP